MTAFVKSPDYLNEIISRAEKRAGLCTTLYNVDLFHQLKKFNGGFATFHISKKK